VRAGRLGNDAQVNTDFTRLSATFESPMFVVTASNGREADGCLVGFATQCSIDPVRFLVCLSEKNRTTRIARDATALVVHSLRYDQRDLAELFGAKTGDEVDKLASIASHPGPGGAPVVAGCDWFAGTILDRHNAGDHIAYLIEVTEAHASDEARLAYPAVRDLSPGHAA
jgi:flavin reductase (DIM6/NTAB) family NADH-FMN oxidoreductase RutF